MVWTWSSPLSAAGGRRGGAGICGNAGNWLDWTEDGRRFAVYGQGQRGDAGSRREVRQARVRQVSSGNGQDDVEHGGQDDVGGVCPHGLTRIVNSVLTHSRGLSPANSISLLVVGCCRRCNKGDATFLSREKAAATFFSRDKNVASPFRYAGGARGRAPYEKSLDTDLIAEKNHLRGPSPAI